MNPPKENEFAINNDGKESFRSRLKELIGGRSVRSVARAWGLSFSTLNNYLNRGSDPSLSAVRAIAIAENVSVDWLALGIEKRRGTSTHEQQGNDIELNGDIERAWNMILTSIELEEARMLIKLIHRKGIESVISSLSPKQQTTLSTLDTELISLSDEEKVRLMALHEAKRGTSEGGELGSTESPAHKAKRAS